MSSTPVIVELSSNDDITNIVKKCNQNFRSMFGANIAMSSDTPDSFDPSGLEASIKKNSDDIIKLSTKIDSIVIPDIPDPFDPSELAEAIQNNTDAISIINDKVDSIEIPDPFDPTYLENAIQENSNNIQANSDAIANIVIPVINIEEIISEAKLAAHPPGSLYWSEDPTSPEELFGGTWEQIKDCFVYAAGSKKVGTTGGEENHLLTIDEMPAHSHQVYNMGYHATGGTTAVHRTQYDSSKNSTNYVVTTNTGGSGSHNNMPPYIVTYCWKRTS